VFFIIPHSSQYFSASQPVHSAEAMPEVSVSVVYWPGSQYEGTIVFAAQIYVSVQSAAYSSDSVNEDPSIRNMSRLCCILKHQRLKS
jgi:hypothetical protein